MNRVGIDFGTTNSAISYFDKVSNRIETYRFRGQQYDYIPTVVAKHKEEADRTIIGFGAQSLHVDGYEIFAFFKMLLAESNESLLVQSGYKDISPVEIAKIYLSELSKNYKVDLGLRDIDHIVMAVPEIWLSDENNPAKEAIKKISREIAGVSISTCSEPTAASAYFTYKYNLNHDKAYEGHILVCDCGGGTIDITLNEINHDNISILFQTGLGKEDEDRIGTAGVAYDKEVIKRVTGSDALDLKLMQEFERRKIFNAEHYMPLLDRYLKNKILDSEVMKIGQLSFKASDMVEAYREVVEPEFLKALESTKAYLDKQNISYRDYEHFKILTVGGFSNFYLVQKSIKDFFESSHEFDERFNTGFTASDKTLAISKGAAILANNKVKTDPIIKHEIRLASSSGDVVLIEKGKKASDYFEAENYMHFTVMKSENFEKYSIKLIIEDDNGTQEVNVKQPLKELAADEMESLNSENIPFWQGELALSMDEEFYFFLHFRDVQTQNTKITPLGQILE